MKECIGCFRIAIWHLRSLDGAGQPHEAFACDSRVCLALAVGTVIDASMVSAGSIDFRVSEDGFPVEASPCTGKAT